MNWIFFFILSFYTIRWDTLAIIIIVSLYRRRRILLTSHSIVHARIVSIKMIIKYTYCFLEWRLITVFGSAPCSSIWNLVWISSSLLLTLLTECKIVVIILSAHYSNITWIHHNQIRAKQVISLYLPFPSLQKLWC